MKTNIGWILVTLALGATGGICWYAVVSDQKFLVKTVAAITVAVAVYFTVIAIRMTVEPNRYMRLRKSHVANENESVKGLDNDL